LDYVPGRRLFIGGIGLLLFVLLISFVAILRQEPWEDEIFGVSTGWSLARSHSQTLSVLADYPHTGSPVPFYGPVSFYAEAWLIRAFGLSLFVWRSACFLGIVACAWICAQFVRVAGGDKWAQLATALFVSLSASVAGTFPGRWDFVATALFLGGVLLFVTSLGGRSSVFWRMGLAGVPIGLALGSSPRALTLTLATVIAFAFMAVAFKEIRKRVILGAIAAFAGSVLVHSLLLHPWGLNSISWYQYLRQATKDDYINATPLLGQGLWVLDLKHHKLLVLSLALLLIVALRGAFKRDPKRTRTLLELKLFLTILAFANMLLMLLMLANALGQTPFWVPPTIAAFMCWVDFRSLRLRSRDYVSIVLVLVALFMLSVEAVEQAVAVALTWDRRNTGALTTFVRQTVPSGSTVYGPIGSYFYPVELSGSQYLYPFEHTTPGLYTKPAPDAGFALDVRICSSRSYAMWPADDRTEHPETQFMPEMLRYRLDQKVAEYDQPPLPKWKTWLLQRMSAVGGKFGFPDAVVYTLRARHCSSD
jgi:hypothetical protein